MQSLKIKYILFLLLIVSINCAVQGPPGGGPEDSIPPQIIEVYPPSNSTGIVPNTDIYINFSEYMDRISVERSVFITPSFTEELNFQWERKKLHIKNTLQPSITYVINIGTGSRDQNNNNLKNSYSWAFSTGESIDNCQISGRIFGETEKSGLFIWAFKLDKNEEINPSEHEPDYTTQSSENGEFKLDYLSSGIYRIFALKDNNNNLKYDIELDLIGIPYCDLKISDKIENFFLTLSKEDTSKTGETPITEKSPKVESFSFITTGSSDTSAAEILCRTPADSLINIPTDTKIKFQFNLPIDTLSLKNGFSLKDSDKNKLPGKITWKKPSYFIFSPLNPFKEDTEYNIFLDSNIVSDTNGSKIKENFNLNFKTGNALSFGSVSGAIKNIPKNENVIIELYNSKLKNLITKKEISNVDRYTINYMIPGEYQIFSFADTDNNGMFTYGSSFPFQASERFTFVPEPIIIRPGWDNENIDITFYNHK